MKADADRYEAAYWSSSPEAKTWLRCLHFLRACACGWVLQIGLNPESTVRYLGIGVDDALEMAEQTEV